MRLQAQGIDLEQYLAGDRPEPGGVRRRAARARPPQAVKVDLALRAVVDAEGIEVDRRRARRRDRRGSPSGSSRSRASVRKELERGGQIAGGTLGHHARQGARVARRARRGRRRRGQPIDRATLELPTTSRRRRTDDAKHRRATERRSDEPTSTTGATTSDRARSATTWSPRSSSRPTGASGPSTSTRGCSRSTSSSSARRSTTRSPTCLRPAAAPRVGEPRQGHQHLHQLARRRDHRRCSRSTTRCSSSSPTSPRSASARPRRRPRCCSRRARTGKRFALPHARVLIHQPYGGAAGQAVDIEIQAKEILRMRELLDEILAHHTGQTGREDRQGHRPRLHHERGRGQGVRHRRRGHHRPRAR